MTIITYISCITTIVYIVWISRFYLAWRRLKETTIVQSKSTESISIIIAIRNEAENIEKLLISLLKQNYPKDFFEIIIVDDHSNDNSREIIELFKQNHNSIKLSFYQLDKRENGKKAALRFAYKKATKDILLFTDGDCYAPPLWLQYTALAFRDKEIKMLLGGVKIGRTHKAFQNFQSLELLSLIGSGAGAAALQNPIMSNGANMAIRSSSLKDIKLKNTKIQIASGDDVFLMLEIKKTFGAKAIRFVKNPNHFIETIAENSWKELINQRLRWVSKSGAYTDPFLITTSVIILATNLSILILLIASFFFLTLWKVLFMVWGLKALVDYFFLRNITTYVSQSKLLRHYPLVATIYPFFIVFTALIGQFTSFHWKERKYTK